MSCQKKEMIEKYEWLPTESSPLLYPMNIYKSNLLFEDGNSTYVPCSGISHDGWGNQGSLHGVGDEFKAVPVRLDITWASFLENKFYTGSWELPTEKMKQLFKEGMIDWRTNKKQTYKQIVVGLAPGGVVVVWMYGADNQIEIGRYQAKETQVAMADYVPENPTITRKDFFDVSASVPEAYENLKKKGIEYGIWDTYREKYNWKAKIDIPNNKFDKITFKMYNGEMETLFDNTLLNDTHKLRAIPRFLSFMWETPQSNKMVMALNLDEEEMFSIFNKIEKNKPSEIILKMSKDYTDKKLYLKQEDKVYPINKIDLENMWQK